MGVREKWSLRSVVGPRSIPVRSTDKYLYKFLCHAEAQKEQKMKNRKTETQTKVRMAF